MYKYNYILVWLVFIILYLAFVYPLHGCGQSKDFLLHQCPQDATGAEVNAIRAFEYSGSTGMFQPGEAEASGCLVVQCGDGLDVSVKYEGKDCLVSSGGEND